MSPVHENEGAPTVSDAFQRNCAPVSSSPAAAKFPTTLALPHTVRFAGTERLDQTGGAATLGQYPKHVADTALDLMFQLTSSLSLGDIVPMPMFPVVSIASGAIQLDQL